MSHSYSHDPLQVQSGNEFHSITLFLTCRMASDDAPTVPAAGQLAESDVSEPSQATTNDEGVPQSPPQELSLNVLDASTGQTVTVVLEDGGMETVAALVPMIEQELRKATGNTDLCVRRLSCGTTILWRLRWCSSIENNSSRTLDYYLLDGEVWIVTTSPHVNDGDMEVFVTTLTGHRITLRLNVSDTTSYLKEKICDQEGIPPDQQRMIFAGQKLEDGRDLGAQNVKNGSTIHLILKICGGGDCLGAKFVDVSNPSGPTRRGWSTSAPEWRVARPGLCIEGVCENRGCPAYKHHVVMNQVFTRFDLIEDRHNCSCPLCHRCVVPTTCAFTRCRWKWVGKKIDRRTRRPVVVRSNGWNSADDAYHRFDEDTSGTDNWLHLMITTEPTTSAEEITCLLCLCEHVPKRHHKALECGHKFHQSCIDNWHRENSTCPLCQGLSHMTAFQRREAGLANIQ